MRSWVGMRCRSDNINRGEHQTSSNVTVYGCTRPQPSRAQGEDRSTAVEILPRMLAAVLVYTQTSHCILQCHTGSHLPDSDRQAHPLIVAMAEPCAWDAFVLLIPACQALQTANQRRCACRCLSQGKAVIRGLLEEVAGLWQPGAPSSDLAAGEHVHAHTGSAVAATALHLVHAHCLAGPLMVLWPLSMPAQPQAGCCLALTGVMHKVNHMCAPAPDAWPATHCKWSGYRWAHIFTD
jgi:hypothetical protein